MYSSRYNISSQVWKTGAREKSYCTVFRIPSTSSTIVHGTDGVQIHRNRNRNTATCTGCRVLLVLVQYSTYYLYNTTTTSTCSST
jgi:hypothetical protein